ncbi:Hypothetical_protein [Hexamita inflata]|uniref:Hypothetical_protein n=1 Tax=Hexamita inflata TaxID=28002 RepID=A0AA86N8U2_9EUKA|nr:Hypothetical protein HINF_LOCUS2575 [Hexamita inflata]
MASQTEPLQFSNHDKQLLCQMTDISVASIGLKLVKQIEENQKLKSIIIELKEYIEKLQLELQRQPDVQPQVIANDNEVTSLRTLIQQQKDRINKMQQIIGSQNESMNEINKKYQKELTEKLKAQFQLEKFQKAQKIQIQINNSDFQMQTDVIPRASRIDRIIQTEIIKIEEPVCQQLPENYENQYYKPRKTLGSREERKKQLLLEKMAAQQSLLEQNQTIQSKINETKPELLQKQNEEHDYDVYFDTIPGMGISEHNQREQKQTEEPPTLPRMPGEPPSFPRVSKEPSKIKSQQIDTQYFELIEDEDSQVKYKTQYIDFESMSRGAVMEGWSSVNKMRQIQMQTEVSKNNSEQNQINVTKKELEQKEQKDNYETIQATHLQENSVEEEIKMQDKRQTIKIQDKLNNDKISQKQQQNFQQTVIDEVNAKILKQYQQFPPSVEIKNNISKIKVVKHQSYLQSIQNVIQNNLLLFEPFQQLTLSVFNQISDTQITQGELNQFSQPSINTFWSNKQWSLNKQELCNIFAKFIEQNTQIQQISSLEMKTLNKNIQPKSITDDKTNTNGFIAYLVWLQLIFQNEALI